MRDRHKKAPLGAGPSGAGEAERILEFVHKVTPFQPAQFATVLVKNGCAFWIGDKPDDNVIAPLNGAAEAVMHGESLQEKRGRRGSLPLGC